MHHFYIVSGWRSRRFSAPFRCAIAVKREEIGMSVPFYLRIQQLKKGPEYDSGCLCLRETEYRKNFSHPLLFRQCLVRLDSIQEQCGSV